MTVIVAILIYGRSIGDVGRLTGIYCSVSNFAHGLREIIDLVLVNQSERILLHSFILINIFEGYDQ